MKNLSIGYIFFYCFIDNNAHISLCQYALLYTMSIHIYFKMNNQKALKTEKVTEHVFLRYLAVYSFYKCFVYFISNILSSSYISAMSFIGNV